MPTYRDIKITDDDLALDGVNAQIIYDLDVIIQDLTNALRESGLLLELIGERSSVQRRLIEQKIILLMESDARIIPGTVELTGATVGNYLLTGETYDFGAVELKILEDL